MGVAVVAIVWCRCSWGDDNNVHATGFATLYMGVVVVRTAVCKCKCRDSAGVTVAELLTVDIEF